MLSSQPRSASGTSLGPAHPSRRPLVVLGSRVNFRNTPHAKRERSRNSTNSVQTARPGTSVNIPWLGREQRRNENTQEAGTLSFEDTVFVVGGEASPSLPGSREKWLEGAPEGHGTPQTAEEISSRDFDLACMFADVRFAVQSVNSLRRGLYRLPRGEYNDTLDQRMRQRIIRYKNQANRILARYGETPTFCTLVAQCPEVVTYIRACGPFESPPSSSAQAPRRARANGKIEESTSQDLLWRNLKMTQEVRQLMRGLTVVSPQRSSRHTDIKVEPED